MRGGARSWFETRSSLPPRRDGPLARGKEHGPFDQGKTQALVVQGRPVFVVRHPRPWTPRGPDPSVPAGPFGVFTSVFVGERRSVKTQGPSSPVVFGRLGTARVRRASDTIVKSIFWPLGGEGDARRALG